MARFPYGWGFMVPDAQVMAHFMVRETFTTPG